MLLLCLVLLVSFAFGGKKKSTFSNVPLQVLDESSFKRWHSFKEIDSQLASLAKRGKKKIVLVGHSAEKRDINLLSIGSGNCN